EGYGQPGVPAPLQGARRRARVAAGQRGHHDRVRATEDRAACGGDAQADRGGPAGGCGGRQRQGDDQREAGAPGPWGGNCGPRGVPAGARVSERGQAAGAEDQPRAWGGPVLEAVMRSAPEDFFVEEVDGFQPSGSGEHLLLTVEKRGLNTAEAARRIARWAGVAEQGVGYAGLKDRHAVTRQRFSVHLPGREAPALAALEGEGLRVLGQARHARKLPRGALAGNRFVLVLRQVRGEKAAVDARLDQVAEQGVPNWFGAQRF